MLFNTWERVCFKNPVAFTYCVNILFYYFLFIYLYLFCMFKCTNSDATDHLKLDWIGH